MSSLCLQDFGRASCFNLSKDATLKFARRWQKLTDGIADHNTPNSVQPTGLMFIAQDLLEN